MKKQILLPLILTLTFYHIENQKQNYGSPYRAAYFFFYIFHFYPFNTSEMQSNLSYGAIL